MDNNRRLSAAYWREIGVSDPVEITRLVNEEIAAQNKRATAEALGVADLAWQSYIEGEIESVPHAVAQLDAAGQHDAANLLIGRWQAEEYSEDETFERDAALAGLDPAALQTLRVRQAEQAAQAEANARGEQLLKTGIDAANAYRTQGLADKVQALVASKLVSGEANPSTETEMRRLIDDAALRAAVDTKRLEKVEADLDASFRAHVASLHGRTPYQTGAERAAYEARWKTEQRAFVLEQNAPTEADYDRGPTAEEMTAAQVERVQRKERPALEPGAFERAKALEAEQAARVGGLGSEWDAARGKPRPQIRTANPGLAAELGSDAEYVSDR